MKKFYLLLPFVSNIVFGQDLQPPTYSHESGFYLEDFDLELFHEDPEVQIIYTLDGSDPTPENLNGKTFQYKTQYPEFAGQLPFDVQNAEIKTFNYQQPILIVDRTNQPNFNSNISTTFSSAPYIPSHQVKKNVIVRARAIKDDHRSEVISKVFFVNNNHSFDYTLPIFSIGIDADKLYNYEDGLWVAGKTFDEWRLENPTIDAVYNTPANYLISGSESEREIALNVFYNNSAIIQQRAGMRLHGNSTRANPNKSVRFYAKSAYGISSINYPLFENYSINKYKRIILRNSGSDSYMTMMLDGFLQSAVKHLGFDTQEYQPVITFLNGEYHGLFNLRERFDEKYFEEVYNVEEDDLDFYENTYLVNNGDSVFNDNLIQFLHENSFQDDENFSNLNTKIDFNNFTDYYVSQIYFGNSDWPHNNNEYWRKRVEYTPDAPYGHDGRLRWVMKDLDLSFDSYTVFNNSLQDAFGATIHNDPTHTLLINKATENQNYKNYFISRFADLLNTTFLPNRMISYIETSASRIEPEMPEHILRWNTIDNMDTWRHHVDRLKTFASERPAYQKQHIVDFFNLEGTFHLTTNIEDVEQGFIKVNSIEINNSTVGIEEDYAIWSGDYFQGVPVTLQAVALPGFTFSHWTGDIESTEPEITITRNENTNITAVFERTLSTGDVNKVDFLLYPNPTADVLNITSASASDIKYSISTILGQQIEKGIKKDQKINVNHLEKGVYLIELIQDNKRVTKKFIKK